VSPEDSDPRSWPTDRLLAHLYDWEHDAFQDDLDFYVALARRTGGPVLELACGSGRVLEPIARLGLEVVGLDRSPSMLKRAEYRLDGVRPSARLVRQEMQTGLPDGSFALVLLALNGFGFVNSISAQRRLLRDASAHLTDDGLLVIDVVNPSALLGEPQGIPVLQCSGVEPTTGAHATKWMVQRLHPAEQLFELHSFYDLVWPDGSFSRVSDRTELRYFSRFELELLLDGAALEIEGLYGDYEAGQLTDDSERMIFVARRGAQMGR
jgi:SAM-dependent methyltransferase